MPALSYALIFISMEDKGDSQRACYMCFGDGHMSLQNPQPLRNIIFFSVNVVHGTFSEYFRLKQKVQFGLLLTKSRQSSSRLKPLLCSLSTFDSPWTEPWNTHTNCIRAFQRNTAASFFWMLTSYSFWILLCQKKPLLFRMPLAVYSSC